MSDAATGRSVAAAALAEKLTSFVNEGDLARVAEHQDAAYSALKASYENLHTFNEFSSARFAEIASQFETHTRILREMKVDLDAVFSRIRNLKQKVATTYPAQYESVPKQPAVGQDEEE